MDNLLIIHVCLINNIDSYQASFLYYNNYVITLFHNVIEQFG